MTANLLAPQSVSVNELCRAKLEQRKQRQAQYYNRDAVDLEPLRRGDVVRLKPFQLGKREWQSNELPTTVPEEVNPPAPGPLSRPEVASTPAVPTEASAKTI